jgi:hypothetical protein
MGVAVAQREIRQFGSATLALAGQTAQPILKVGLGC